MVVHCASDGIPILRDIEGAEPCGGPSPSERHANGSGGIQGELSTNATAVRNPTGGIHNAIGSGEVEGNVEGEGEADRQTSFHEAIGSGSVTGAVAGEGEAERIV